MSIRVVVADDQQIVREGFTALLETQADITVVGSAADGEEAIRVCGEQQPDVVLMDVRMPGVDGIEATRAPRRDEGDHPHHLRPRRLRLRRAERRRQRLPAQGRGAERLFEAVRVVAAGEALLAPAVTRRLIAEFARQRPRVRPTPERLSELTPRETEVLRLIAEGLSNLEIADRLVLSDETVKTHVSRVLFKLGLRDRTQAVVAAYESGLVEPRRA